MGIYLASLDGDQKRLLQGVETAEYVYPGLVVFTRQGMLMVQGLDQERGQVTGDPETLADSVGSFSVSARGQIAYRVGGASSRRLTWFDRAGKMQSIASDLYAGYPEISPDGRRLALDLTAQNNEMFGSWISFETI